MLWWAAVPEGAMRHLGWVAAGTRQLEPARQAISAWIRLSGDFGRAWLLKVGEVVEPCCFRS